MLTSFIKSHSHEKDFYEKFRRFEFRYKKHKEALFNSASPRQLQFSFCAASSEMPVVAFPDLQRLSLVQSADKLS